MRNTPIDRRTFVGLAGVAAATLVVGGCSSEAPVEETAEAAKETDAANAADTTADTAAAPEPSTPETTASTEPAEPEPESEPEPEPAAAGSGVLVAYFSVSGNTKAVAEAIAEKTDGDLFAITPVEEYTAADTEYNDDNSRTSVERPQRDTIVVELVENAPANWADYDVVYFGFPIWWGAQSWAVNEFLRQNDFAGKTVIPFCTSGSSPMVDSSTLEAIAGSGTWKKGMRISSASDTSDIDSLIAEA